MTLLLTNDDGIHSPGLHALEQALAKNHTLYVMAPDSERSGMSHSITLRGPLRVKAFGEKRFACSGTPADCVMLAHRGELIPSFDLVLSGINNGPNLGTDVVYSGTAAAARQAALMGVPGIALSLASLKGPWVFDWAAQWVAENLEELQASLQTGTFLNINFPENPIHPLQTRITTLSPRTYVDKIRTFQAPDGDWYCFSQGALAEHDLEPGSDWYEVNAGNISLSTVEVFPLSRGEPLALNGLDSKQRSL